MKQVLKDVSNLLLVVLCDYVLGAVEGLLLEQPTHVALSNGTVSVGFQNYYDSNVTLKNSSILLIDASTNQTVAKKKLPQNQYQGIVDFECFYFKSAGNYQFKMASEISNGTNSLWNVEDIPLSVTWPVFHIDLRRISKGLGSSLQVGLFTNEHLCPMNKTVASLDIILTSTLYELGQLIANETVGLRTSKELALSKSQWVKVDCHLVGQVTYITVLLKSTDTHSVIASTGPVDLVHRFGYQLTVVQEAICESSVVVSVISPPCTSTGGRVTVFKDTLGPPGQRALKRHEGIMNPEDSQMEFNCTLFDEGTNKYCFEFSHLRPTSSPPRAKECVLIQRNVGYWSLWQAWSPCNVTCGDGIRKRYRECLTSFPVMTKQNCTGRLQETSPCSLEACSTTKSSPIVPLDPESGQSTNNLVTVTGISLCLSIIFATILITLWRKLCRAQKCSTPIRCDSAHSPSFRKNSDEESICQKRQQRVSFSEGGEASCASLGEPTDIPLNFRKSLHFAQENEGASTGESFQSNAKKIIPPIFSYRLAQQQLKEMKKRGLTETTKVYHVSQNPLTDAVVNTSVSTESQEAASANKFRIKSPFLEPTLGHLTLSQDRPCSRVDFIISQANPILSPSQSLMRRGHPRYPDNKGEQLERGYPRSSQFRRTASFHESRKSKPFRKRSMSTLTPCHTSHSYYGARMWNHVPEEQHQLQSKVLSQNTEELKLCYGTGLINEPETYGVQNAHKWDAPEKKADLVSSRQPGLQGLCVDGSEQKRNRRGPLLSHTDAWRKEPTMLPVSHERGLALSPTQYRKSKCQSFPSDPEYHFYDNTTFGLTESEQQMMDLPGYFGSNEEDETSTLSIEKLVL